MKFLLYALNFAPEITGCGKYNSELVEWLTSHGHEVRVITAPPYYPDWNIQSPYSGHRYKKERFSQNEKITRCPLYVPKNVNGKTRLLHLASFAISSFPALLSIAKWKPNIIFSVAPTLFTAPGALFLSKITGAKSWLHIQDFEIDAAFTLGMLNNKVLKQAALVFENRIFQNFDIVSTISDNMAQLLEQKGVNAKKAYLLPNWSDISNIHPIDGNNDLKCIYREKLKYKNSDIVLLSSGTMGDKQGLEIIINAAKKLIEHKNIKFLLCGEGPAKKKLVASAEELCNVSFLPLQPLDKLNDLFNVADIHLLPQKSGAADLVMPSKLTGMLSSGKPVIATTFDNTQIAKIVSTCGLVTEPENIHDFVKAILSLANNKPLRNKLGIKAREYAKENLDKDTILNKFNQKLYQL